MKQKRVEKLEVFKVERGRLSGKPYYAIGGVVEDQEYAPSGFVEERGYTFTLQMSETCYEHLESQGIDMRAFLQNLLNRDAVIQPKV